MDVSFCEAIFIGYTILPDKYFRIKSMLKKPIPEFFQSAGNVLES